MGVCIMPIYLNGKTYNDVQIGSKIKADLPELTKPAAGSEQILEGYQAINDSGQIVNGVIESLYDNSYTFDCIGDIYLDDNNNCLNWWDDIPYEYYAFTNSTIFALDYSIITSAAGLTADKIVSGNTILGVEGTHVCSGGSSQGKNWVFLANVTPTEGVASIYTDYDEFPLSTIFKAVFSDGGTNFVLYAFYDSLSEDWLSYYFSSLGESYTNNYFSIDSGNILWNFAGSMASSSTGVNLYNGLIDIQVYALI